MASAAEQGARAVVLLAIFAGIDGHGLMLDPISRNAREGITTLGGNMWFSQGCTIGCSQCNDTGVPVQPGFPLSVFWGSLGFCSSEERQQQTKPRHIQRQEIHPFAKQAREHRRLAGCSLDR